MLRLCGVLSGKEQFKSVIGMIDSQDSSWESKFSSIVDLDSLKVTYLHDPQLNLGRLDETELRCLFETFREVSELCYNDQTFQLLVLLTLLVSISPIFYARFFQMKVVPYILACKPSFLDSFLIKKCVGRGIKLENTTNFGLFCCVFEEI